jgi:hypothetical protein
MVTELGTVLEETKFPLLEGTVKDNLNPVRFWF